MPALPACVRIILTVCLLGTWSWHANAQHRYDYTWMLGYSNETLPDTIWWMSKLDFNTSPATITVVDGRSDMDRMAASISHPQSGSLLFYGNGCHIRGANLDYLQFGDTLVPPIFYNDYCFAVGIPPQDGMIVLPDPGKEDGYWVFNQVIEIKQVPTFYLHKILYLAYVDIGLNNGLGAVTSKQIRMGNDSLFAGLTAYRHANDKDWWIIIGKEFYHEYYKILVNEAGVQWLDTIVLQTNIKNKKRSSGGQNFFSPNGELYFHFAGPDDDIFMMDFDRATGDVSNIRVISGWDTMGLFGGASISPSGQFLYVNNGIKIWQRDLWDPDSTSNLVLVGEWDNYFEHEGWAVGFGLQRLGPDCRLYISPTTWARHVHVILYPDRKGAACEFRQRYIRTPTNIGASLPNFPYYRVGTDFPLCDSTHLGFDSVSSVTPSEPLSSQPFSLSPNPFNNSLQVYAGDDLIATGTILTIYDAIGRMVHQEPVTAQVMGILTATWPPGHYFITWMAPGVPPRYANAVKVE